MTKTEAAECIAALIEALSVYGDSVATAEVVATVATLPFDGDRATYIQTIADAARAVWQRKLTAATQRAQKVDWRVTAMAAMSVMPLSTTTH
ncbi:MAG TPA: hypothetical protein VNJ02_18500 [Vicinamibacterales bacterium]|nr:hypothetical protein [Vicinamibacterales bacterium]